MINMNSFSTIFDLTEKMTQMFNGCVTRNKELSEENDELKAKLEDKYSNDKEIIRLRKELDECKAQLNHSFRITEKEHQAILDWQQNHNLKKHGGETVYSGAIGGNLTFEFIPTSIGTIGTVKCSCGEKFTFSDL